MAVVKISGRQYPSVYMMTALLLQPFIITALGLKTATPLQKFINYGVRFAIYGDFSKYTSKPLKDLMYESNKGKNIYFQPNMELAVDKLCR